MKFFALTSVVFAAVTTLPAPSTNTASVSYDQTYNNANGSLDTVIHKEEERLLYSQQRRLACSNGGNGLEPKYTTFGSLPSFPKIGGAFAVAGWNSTSCTTCWEITYNDKSINVLAADHAGAGTSNIATSNQAKVLGRVPVSYAQVATSQCY